MTKAFSKSYSVNNDLLPEVKNSLNLAVQNSRLNLLISGVFQRSPRAMFSPDGRKIFAINGTSVILANSLTGEHLDQFTSSSLKPVRIASIAISPDTRFLAMGGDDGTVQVIDLESRKTISHLHHRSSILSLAFSPDGQEL